jgi:hypothetical protein
MAPVSQTTCILATVFFKHKYITNPTVTPADSIIVATANLSHIIQTSIMAKQLNDINLANLTHLQSIIKSSPAFSQPTQTVPYTQSPLPPPSTQTPRVPLNPRLYSHSQLYVTMKATMKMNQNRDTQGCYPTIT